MMAKKVTVTLEDDLAGGPADATVRFAVNGTEYEIGLSATRRSWAWRVRVRRGPLGHTVLEARPD
jgi:hypothetical protein